MDVGKWHGGGEPVSRVRKLRQDLRAIGDVALGAVDPADAVRRHLRYEDAAIRVHGQVWAENTNPERILIVAVGKAAAPMAAAAAGILSSDTSRSPGGLVITKYGHAAGRALPPSIQVFEAGHPLPDSNGLQAAEALILRLGTLGPGDRVLLLLSGGGSALLPAPVAGVTLDDLQALTTLLLRAGATIDEMNAVRKHLSRLKGGQLARLASPAPIASLILSDVVGDSLDVIASGPTAPDPTTYGNALEILSRYGLVERIPVAIGAHLRAGDAGEREETPKPGDPVFESVTNVIVGSNHLAACAAVAEAEARGYRSLLLTTFIEGEAREVARVAVGLAKGIRVHGTPVASPACLVWGGETTVTLRGEGKGGRNQELALAAALGLEGMEGVAMMALATDGTDGPTDAAGAIVDGTTAARARAQGFDPRAALSENDAYPLLDATGDILRTGPTATNVNDLLVMLVD